MSTQTAQPSNEDEAQTTPVLFHHCIDVYNAMRDESKLVQEGDERALVYEGHLTRLITQQLGLAVPYYTSATKALKRMGCIRQIRRGGGNAMSQWVLLKAPTEKDFNEAQPRKVARTTKVDMVEQQVRDLTARVNSLESIVGQLFDFDKKENKSA